MTLYNYQIKFCQSCGIALETNSPRGTNSDGTINNEHCDYCLYEGKYTYQCTMENLLEKWVEYTDQYNKHTGTSYTPQALRVVMTKRLPTLKRWKQRKENKGGNGTSFDTISQITIYINQHLLDDIGLDILAEKAGLSKFHFLREFKSVTGENVGTYIQRLRMEYIAHLLLTTRRTINSILEDVHYQSRNSLSKAFKQHYGLSPANFREQQKAGGNKLVIKKKKRFKPEIRWIDTKKVIYISLFDKYETLKGLKKSWDEIIRYNDELNIIKGEYFCITMKDNTNLGNIFIACETDQDITPSNNLNIMTIPEGEYAIFRYKGKQSGLANFYRDIYCKWLPLTKYEKKPFMSYEVYEKSPFENIPHQFQTEIYIPIQNCISW